MANKYCNLDGSKKIKDEYQKINIGFDKVEEDVNKIDERVDEIITTPVEDVSAEEIIDARGGRPVLGKRFEDIETDIEDLEVELAAHKAESATWIRIDTLSAPIELPSGGIEDAISVPTSEIISGSKVYAIEFRLLSSDARSSSISICVGLDTSASGIIVGSPLNLPNLTDIFVANRLVNANSPNEILFYGLKGINGNIVPCYVYRIFRLKEGVI